MGFFPSTAETLELHAALGRTEAEVTLVEHYAKENHLFRNAGNPVPKFTQVLSLDLSKVEPSLAGPKRPQDLVPLRSMKDSFRKALTAPINERGFAASTARRLRANRSRRQQQPLGEHRPRRP